MSSAWESTIIGLGTGLFVLAISLLVKRSAWRTAVMLALGAGMIAFVVWPRATLATVPDLSDLSRDDAELRLVSKKLVGVPQLQMAPGTRPDYVVAQSQSPLPGTKVQRGTLIRYSVSASSSILPTQLGTANPSASGGTLSVFRPMNDIVVASRGADNIFRFEIEGTIDGVDLAKSTLLLWIQPITPPADQPGWFLQRQPSNGIRSVSGGRWRGLCQLGNQQYAPHEGDVVEIAVSVVPAEEAFRLDAKQGPLTAVVLPGLASTPIRTTVRIR